MALLVCNSFAISSHNLQFQPKKRSNNSLSVVACAKPETAAPILNRNSFPKDFIFGTSSAAYQFEGAADKYGRGPSIWDTFSHEHPEKILDGSNGDVAVDQYHRYKEDVQLMKDMNLDAYRLSISWSRILPKGRRKTDADVNEEGIEYYNNLINELLANGIKPFVTLFHWDLPQALQDEYGGFLDRKISPDYEDYVKLCFERFGDRVKHWITLNEPMIFTAHGFSFGGMAPGRSTESGGNSGKEPYIVAHNLLHAHAKAVELYKRDFQKSQKGVIGISLNSRWFLPQSKKDADIEAAKRALDYEFGWFLKPLALGYWPECMCSQIGERMPKLTTDEVDLIHGSYDFIGLNYYSGCYARDKQGVYDPPSLSTDSCCEITQFDANGKLIGPVSGSGRVSVYPEGIRAVLNYVKEESNNSPMYITENGIDELNNPILKLEQALYDPHRVDYYSRHLSNVYSAIRDDDVNLKGYFAWSLMDNYEWSNGYAVRFGLNFVDYNNNLKRHPKLSAEWLKNFLKKH